MIKIWETRESLDIFRNSIFKFVKPSTNNSVFNYNNPKGIKNITRLRLDLCHLREHIFKHSFPNLLNSIRVGYWINFSSSLLSHVPRVLLKKKHSWAPWETKNSTFQKQPPELFYEKRYFRNLEKFTGKHLCWSIFFNKVAVLRPTTLLKKRLWNRCFPVNFAKFLKAPFLQNTPDNCFWLFGGNFFDTNFNANNYP